MHRIGFVLFPGAQILSTAPVSVFEMANLTAGKPFYELQIFPKTEARSAPRGASRSRRSLLATRLSTPFLIGAGAEIETPTPKLLEFSPKGPRYRDAWRPPAPARSSLQRPGFSTVGARRLIGLMHASCRRGFRR